jgi:hypothetical protein
MNLIITCPADAPMSFWTLERCHHCGKRLKTEEIKPGEWFAVPEAELMAIAFQMPEDSDSEIWPPGKWIEAAAIPLESPFWTLA